MDFIWLPNRQQIVNNILHCKIQPLLQYKNIQGDDELYMYLYIQIRMHALMRKIFVINSVIHLQRRVRVLKT